MTALVALLAAPAAAAVRSSTAGAPLTGDPAGLRLAREVNRAYADVPGVRVDVASNGAVVVRFTLVLRNGVAVAEQALVDEGAERPTLLVRRESEGTFVRDANRSCWRSVPKSDPQELTDVGGPMLSGPGRVSKPRVAGGTVTLTLTREGRTSRLVVDRKTSRLRSMDAGRMVARFTSLARRPALPLPKPLCRS